MVEPIAEAIRCILTLGASVPSVSNTTITSPPGLIGNIVSSVEYDFPLRWWILDNSGSMMTNDGRRLLETKRRTDVRWITSTRWNELRECVNFHAQLAALLQAPTKLSLLNAPGRGLARNYGVAEMGRDFLEQELKSLKTSLYELNPSGCTPLPWHIDKMYEAIRDMEDSLRQEGKKVVVVIATDGVPTDANGWTSPSVDDQFERALQRLQSLPVWIVVRLCTGEEKIVSYYERLDQNLELSLEVLDDFEDEAKEVYQHNPWLTYGLPLHRAREMGIHHKLMDLLDERPFTLDEVVEFLELLLGQSVVNWPDPHTDLAGFVVSLRGSLKKELKQYNPVRRRLMPWIDIRALERKYGPGNNRALLVIAIIVVIIAIVISYV